MVYPEGIPALLNLAALPFELLIEARAVLSLIIPLNEQPYGIYDSTGNIALSVDGFIELSVINDSQLANYRIEEGAFSTYNKVNTPAEYRMTVVKEVNDDTFYGAYATPLAGINRKVGTFGFLRLLDAISNDINLYSILTPDRTFMNCNLKRYDYQRNSENGTNILIIGLIFEEVMNTDEVVFNAQNTKTQSAKPIVSGGEVTAVP